MPASKIDTGEEKLGEGMTIQNPSAKTPRKSSFELLRIISMMILVGVHAASHSGFVFEPGVITLPRLWWYFMQTAGCVALSIFMMISGYFMVTDTKDSLDIKRILKMWGQVAFYSVVLYLVSCASGAKEFSVILLIKSFFPITFATWWFASVYFVIYLLHPFYNILLQKLTKDQYRAMLLLMIVIWYVIPTITKEKFQSNDLIWLMMLYAIGGYIRLHGLCPGWDAKKWGKVCILMFAVRIAVCLLLLYLGTKSEMADRNIKHFIVNQQSVFTAICIVPFFMVFEKMELGHNKWINVIASGTFGVYLLHDSKIGHAFFWEKLFPISKIGDSWLLFPYSLLVVLLVFSICLFIDLARRQTVEKLYMKLVNKYADTLEKPIKRFDSFLSRNI